MRIRKQTELVKTVWFKGGRCPYSFIIASNDITAIENRFNSWCKIHKLNPIDASKKSWIN